MDVLNSRLPRVLFRTIGPFAVLKIDFCNTGRRSFRVCVAICDAGVIEQLLQGLCHIGSQFWHDPVKNGMVRRRMAAAR